MCFQWGLSDDASRQEKEIFALVLPQFSLDWLKLEENLTVKDKTGAKPVKFFEWAHLSAGTTTALSVSEGLYAHLKSLESCQHAKEIKILVLRCIH